MPWTITKDFIADPTAPVASNANAVGVVGPSNAAMTAEQIVAHPQGRRFRIKDADGEVYYEGVIVVTTDDGDEAEFRPLNDFGTPNGGATDIEYLDDGGNWRLV